MIEQIKQALEDQNGPSLTHSEWLRYLISEVEELQKALEACKVYLESSPSWNEKKYTVYNKIEQALERSETT